MKKNIDLVKSPSMNEPKRETPSIPTKKGSVSNDNHNAKKMEVVKPMAPPPVANKPPIAPSSYAAHK